MATPTSDGQMATATKQEATEFRMPALGADMQSGTVAQWRIKPGDRVARGDVVAVVETDKGAIEIEVFATGTVEQLLVPVGQKVPVGTPLALLRTAEPAPMLPPVVQAPAPLPALVREIPAPPAAAKPTGAGLRVSPLARKVAESLGVDLAKLVGSVPGGAINRADVERAAAARAAVPAWVKPPSVAPVPPTPPSAETLAGRQAAMRRAIAGAMARSNREIPHYYLETTINLQPTLDWLQQENLKRSVSDRLLPAALLLKAVAHAVHEVPEMNGFWTNDELQPSEAIHLGVAIALRQGGLVTPAIHHTDLLSIDELNLALRDLVMRARSGTLRGSEVTDPTLTVTNLGDLGVEKVFGVIYPPQVALVGFGAIVQRPWAIDGLLGVRPVVTATLAGDHRASDGHRGGRFLAAIARLLKEPQKL